MYFLELHLSAYEDDSLSNVARSTWDDEFPSPFSCNYARLLLNVRQQHPWIQLERLKVYSSNESTVFFS